MNKSAINLLVVEKNEKFVGIIRQVLEEINEKQTAYRLNMVHTDSRHQALKTAKAHHPLLVITETEIDQEMDGIELIKEINQSFFLPVIYYSHHYSRELLHQARSTPIAGYLLRSDDAPKSMELKSTLELALMELQRSG